MDYEFLIKQKIAELEDTIIDLIDLSKYYLKKKDFKSLDNISRQLYRTQYALDILNSLL